MWYKNRVCQSAYGLNRNRVGTSGAKKSPLVYADFGVLLSRFTRWRRACAREIRVLKMGSQMIWYRLGHPSAGWKVCRCSSSWTPGSSAHAACSEGASSPFGQRGFASGLSIARWIERPGEDYSWGTAPTGRLFYSGSLLDRDRSSVTLNGSRSKRTGNVGGDPTWISCVTTDTHARAAFFG